MDEVLKKIDEFEENGDYKGMINYIISLPDEYRTLDIAFTYISALINDNDYGTAKQQLKAVFPACTEPAELAQVYYYSGYAVTQLGGNPVLGLALLKEAFLQDPNDELGLEIEQECRDTLEKINAHIAKFHELCGAAAAEIKRLGSGAESGRTLKGSALLAGMSFLTIFRSVPALDGYWLSTDGDDKPIEGESREVLAGWLADAIGFTDHESLMKLFSESKFFNVSVMVNDALAYINGTPSFDPDTLDHKSRDAFEVFCVLVRCFKDHLPPAGVLGWDIAKRTAVARFAYISGIIGENELNEIKRGLLDLAKELTDPAEFLTSMLFGSALATYDAQNNSIISAYNSINYTMNEIVTCGLFGCTFLPEE